MVNTFLPVKPNREPQKNRKFWTNLLLISYLIRKPLIKYFFYSTMVVPSFFGFSVKKAKNSLELIISPDCRKKPIKTIKNNKKTIKVYSVSIFFAPRWVVSWNCVTFCMKCFDSIYFLFPHYRQKVYEKLKNWSV